MHDDLAPLRRARDLLVHGDSVDEVITDLRWTFGLPFVDAMAAVAACIVLTEGGMTFAEEPFARPYV